MKKLPLILVLVLSTLILTACGNKEVSPQTFSGSGITVTLDDSFIESSSSYAAFYLSSDTILFSANKEDKAEYTDYTLEAYLESVLDSSDSEVYNTDIESSESGDYVYTYYAAYIDGDEIAYMLICMEGESHFYAINFICYKSIMDDNPEQFIEWADSIIVE